MTGYTEIACPVCGVGVALVPNGYVEVWWDAFTIEHEGDGTHTLTQDRTKIYFPPQEAIH